MAALAAPRLLAALLALARARSGGAEVCAEGPESRRPRYARVGGSIEMMWQPPEGAAKGILFIAHGCQHQGTDVFSDVGPDGWRQEECSSSNFGRCLGLPEEVKLRQAARRRGYLVMSVSGGTGSRSCWNMQSDPPRVAEAVRHVIAAEALPEDIAVLATGASSGGAFVGTLAAPLGRGGGLPNLRCIVPQISAAAGENRGVPALYVHMPKDSRTAARVEAQVQDLRRRGLRASELRVHPTPVTRELLGRCMPVEAAERGLEALRRAGLLDPSGLLRRSSRMRLWVEPLRSALGAWAGDTLVADESCVAELMNVADAVHEFTAEFSEEMLDFCEGKGVA